VSARVAAAQATRKALRVACASIQSRFRHALADHSAMARERWCEVERCPVDDSLLDGTPPSYGAPNN